VSKIFEYCVLHKFEAVFESDSLQSVLRKKLSCSHALFVLSQITDYFVNHGSSLYIASLDASKAFDRVNHTKVFNKLLKKGLSGRIIRVLIDWYGKLFCMVKRNGSFSSWFCVKSGVRQGGILSPFLFNIYIDSVISSLRLPDYGCHLRGEYVGCIVYADDILLLSASVTSLRKVVFLT